MEQIKRTNHRQLYVLGALFAVVLIFLDQITKLLAVAKLKGQDAFVIIKGVFELHYLENRGAAFGVMQGKKVFFIIITIVMVLFLIYAFGRIPAEKRFYPLHVICITLFAGAVGNFIDRVIHNYVIDFFYFSLIDFPIFNVADIYVTCSVALFVILFLFYYKEAELDRLSVLIFHRHKDTKDINKTEQ